MYCGAKSVSGKVLSLAPPLAGLPVGQLYRAVLDILPGVPREQSWWHESRDLLSMLQRSSYSQASEARDRVFALMNMCSDAHVAQSIAPSYRNTDMKVVQETFRYLFGFTDSDYNHSWYNAQQIIKSCSTMSSLIENLGKIKAEALSIDGRNSIALSMDELYRMSEGRGRDVSGALRFGLRYANVRQEQIGPRTFEAMTSHTEGGRELVQLLLDWRGSEIVVTEGVLTAAAGNPGQGKEVMQLLLEQRGSEVEVTEGVITAAAGNYGQGKEIIQVFRDWRGESV